VDHIGVPNIPRKMSGTDPTGPRRFLETVRSTAVAGWVASRCSFGCRIITVSAEYCPAPERHRVRASPAAGIAEPATFSPGLKRVAPLPDLASGAVVYGLRRPACAALKGIPWSYKYHPLSIKYTLSPSSAEKHPIF